LLGIICIIIISSDAFSAGFLQLPGGGEPQLCGGGAELCCGGRRVGFRQRQPSRRRIARRCRGWPRALHCREQRGDRHAGGHLVSQLRMLAIPGLLTPTPSLSRQSGPRGRRCDSVVQFCQSLLRVQLASRSSPAAVHRHLQQPCLTPSHLRGPEARCCCVRCCRCCVVAP